jgi:hypothetical protein
LVSPADILHLAQLYQARATDAIQLAINPEISAEPDQKTSPLLADKIRPGPLAD